MKHFESIPGGRRFAARVLALAMACLTWVAGSVEARPLYFQTFTGIYGLVPGEDLYACGVCHRLWGGTSSRNPFGVAVEQQLYIGKPIAQAILDVESADTDGDGFTNGDEIAIHGTLPGYSCSNYELALNPPANFQELITPGVPTCLDPKDILVAPLSANFSTQVNKSENVDVLVKNNGSVDPISVSGIDLLPGAPASISISAPAVPTVIPLGGSVTVTVTFAPTVSGLVSATLRVTSDDPDEPTIDVPVSAIGFVRPLAPVADRARCEKSVERAVERYSRDVLREWSNCFLDEVSGLACNAGRRDQRLARAGAKLNHKIGGDGDRSCAKKGLTPNLLGMEASCPAPCGSIALGSMSALANCIACQVDAGRDELLTAVVGTAPPDLPPNRPAGDALRCNRLLSRMSQKGIGDIQKALASCEQDNVTAGSPVDCSVSTAAKVSRAQELVNLTPDLCASTTDLEGCLFGTSPAPTCLGDTASSVAERLVDTVYPEL